jgi:hypothetical protein
MLCTQATSVLVVDEFHLPLRLDAHSHLRRPFLDTHSRCKYSIATSTSVTTSKIASARYADDDNRGERNQRICSRSTPRSRRCTITTACYTSTMGDGHGGEIGACELSTSGSCLGLGAPCDEHSRCGVEVPEVQSVNPHQRPSLPFFNYANV